MASVAMNNSLAVYAFAGEEPNVLRGSEADLQRWDRWFAWDRRMEKACWAKTYTTPTGHVHQQWWYANQRRYWRSKDSKFWVNK